MTTDTSKQSQCDAILAFLRRGGMITQLEALDLFGVLRLASRINDLRNRGHVIETITETVYNRDGDPCRVARYRLVE
jgi:hypothetical protein